MNKLISGFSGLFITLIILSSCSKNNVAQKSEWDDMYFSSVDRENLAASNKEFYDQNFNETYQEPLNSDQASEYSDVNYSSKTVNPEYIAKYTSNSPEDSDPEVSTEYFDENYNKSDESEEIIPQRYSSYSGSNAGGFGIYPSFAFGYGSGFGYNPYYSPFGFNEPFGYSPYYGYPYSSYGSRLSLSLQFGYGSSFYNPYSSFYSPWGRYPSAFGYGYGIPQGYGYCPPAYGGAYSAGSTYYYTRNDVTTNTYRNVASVRNVTRGPRSSRGSVSSHRNDYRSGDNDLRFIPDGKSTIVSNAQSTSGRTQNNYYKRTSSRNTTDQNTRGYQKTGRSYNDSGTRSRTSGISSSNYSRNSGSSYKTGSSRGSIFRALTGSGGSNTRSGNGRSSFYSNPSRSSGSSYRSSSGSSGRSFSSGSSRSSSGSSRSSSSGASRGSSSGSKRGN